MREDPAVSDTSEEPEDPDTSRPEDTSSADLAARKLADRQGNRFGKPGTEKRG